MTGDYYELRLYQCVPGRIPDLHRRMSRDVPPMFEANGVPRPLIYWKSYSSPRAPLYGYMLKWSDLDARMASFQKFYADPAWLKHREESNGGTQMVDRIDVFILRPEGPVSSFSPEDANPSMIYDLRLQQVLSRDAPAAMRAWREVDLPVLEGGGAKVLGTFTMWFGTRMPQIVSLLGWPDMATLQGAHAVWDVDPAVKEQRARERSHFGRPLFERCETHLMKREI